MRTPDDPLATMTLIVTPRVISEFGQTFMLGDRILAQETYDTAREKAFLPVTRARNVPSLDEKWRRGVVSYALSYESILNVYLRDLGSARFKIEYVKQLTRARGELDSLSFGAHDLGELFRRHVVCCNRAAANYSELFRKRPETINAIDFLLRATNFGITLLMLLLERQLSAPLWIILEANERITNALSEMERMPEMKDQSGSLSGSLTFLEGSLNLPQPRGAK